MDSSVLTARTIIEASPRHRIERILWLHRTDRWYFGDFLRHAGWLSWLREAFPAASIDLASHPSYLSLYDDARFTGFLDARTISAAAVRSADLVIEPGPYKPEPSDDRIPLLLATWDSGWALRTHGQVTRHGTKNELNYFRAAHPCAITGCRSTPPTPPVLSSDEIAVVDDALARKLPGTAPVIVYNPTASTPFTRDTQIPKEVDNALSVREHAVVLQRLLVVLPGHLFVVGASVKQDDTHNAERIDALSRMADPSRVLSINDLPVPGLLGIRGFTTLLASNRVCSMAGSGTGTNTHLAGLLGVRSMSIERGVDAPMLANWASPDFQMGSFRWRNPSPCTAIHTLDWSQRTDAALAGAAESFLAHHALLHGPFLGAIFASTQHVAGPVRGFAASWPTDPVEALRCAQHLLTIMRAPARSHFATFTDEAAYLALKFGIPERGLLSLVAALAGPQGEPRNTAVNLFQDSNLHKLLIRLNEHVNDETHSPEPGAA